MKVEALKAEEIAEFYRDHSYQGAKMPHLDKALTRLFPWEKQDKTFLLPNPIQDEGSHVRIETPEGPKYVSYLPVAVFPGQIQAPGVDLFHRLPYMGLNVQAMIHWKHKGYREAKTWAFWKKKASKENLKHVGEVEDPSLADEDSEIQAELMEKEIANTKSPLNQIHVVFQVTADTPEDLKEQCRLLKEDLDGEGFVVHTPTADQAEFYDAWLPNSHWSPVGYSHPVLPDRTAALVMPGAHDKLGDPVGPPRGFLRNGSIFRFSLSWGARADVSSHLCIAGRTGSGKTTLIDAIVEDTMLTTLSRGILIDRKGEHAHWLDHPTLGKVTQQIFLDGIEYPGVLDPFHLIEQDIHDAKEVAADYIEHILGLDKEKETYARQNDVLTAIENAVKSGNPCMAQVIREMEKETMRPEAREMAQTLRRAQALPLGRLIFGEVKKEQKIRFPKTGLLILQIRKLKLPGKGQKATRLSHKLSEAIMTGISVINNQFLLEGKDEGIFSFIALDELELYTRTRTGREQVNEINRLGRSQFCGAMLASQNPSDIPEEIRNQAGYFICLGTKTHQETLLAMQALNLNPENKEVYEGLLELGAEQSERPTKKGKRRNGKTRKGLCETFRIG